MAKLTAPERKSAPPQAVRHDIRLTPVQQIATLKLRMNPLNAKFFSEESPEYFAKLTKDIKERGILVPLIAKRDGTLLAGHNRLQVADALMLNTVPVQFVEENEHWCLSEAQEREFLIKDNLLRRQFSSDEWIEKYRILYPDFDESVMQASRTGLNAAQIAEDTGQSKSAVQKQLQKFRRERNDTAKVERVHVGAKELRAAIERALSVILVDVSQAKEILEEVL
jgi:hypothetical protein